MWPCVCVWAIQRMCYMAQWGRRICIRKFVVSHGGARDTVHVRVYDAGLSHRNTNRPGKWRIKRTTSHRMGSSAVPPTAGPHPNILMCREPLSRNEQSIKSIDIIYQIPYNVNIHLLYSTLFIADLNCICGHILLTIKYTTTTNCYIVFYHLFNNS